VVAGGDGVVVGGVVVGGVVAGAEGVAGGVVVAGGAEGVAGGVVVGGAVAAAATCCVYFSKLYIKYLCLIISSLSITSPIFIIIKFISLLY